MSEVVTDKDKEYEAREAAAAPGDAQPNADRVNNRTLRPTGEMFRSPKSSRWSPASTSRPASTRWARSSRANAS